MSKVTNTWLEKPVGISKNEVPTGDIDGVNDEFIITEDPFTGSLQVFIDGLLDSEYTYDSPSKTITMNTAPSLGQDIRVIYNY